MITNNSKKYISELQLLEPDQSLSPISDLQFLNLESSEEEKVQSFINDKSLISFVSGVSAQARQDVLNAMLLAQLAASKRYAQATEIEKWYNAFVDVLKQIGWVGGSTDVFDFTSAENLFDMQNAILDILGAAIGGDYLAIVKKSIEALKGLSSADKRIVAFERNTNYFEKGTFQIGLVSEENGAISIRLGAFFLDSKETITKVLFFKSTKNTSNLRYSTANLSLNPDIYSLIRHDIINKIEDRINKYVSELEI